MGKSFLVLASLVLVGFNANASESWQSTVETDSIGKVCVGSVATKEDKNHFTFQVRVHEGLVSPTEIMITRQGPALAAKGFEGQVGKNGPVLQVSSLASSGTTTEYFLALPHSLSNVLSAMSLNKDFELKPIGAKSPELDISLKNFTSVLKTLTQCANSQTLANQEFEQVLVGTTAFSVDLNRLTPNAMQQLRQISVDAYKVFAQRKANLQAMQDLRKKYQTELDQYDHLQARINQINGTELPALASKRAKLVTSLAQAQQEQKDTQTNLPTIQARVNTAQVAYDKADAIFEPLVPQHDTYSNNVDTAESNLSASKARLRQVESDINTAEAKGRELQSRISDLQYEISRLNSQLPQARWDLQQAERNLNSFNYQGAIDQYLEMHNYSGLQSQEQLLSSQQMAAHNDTAQALSQRQQAMQALQQCKAGGATADCSSQQAAVQNAQSAYQVAAQRENQINSQLQNVREQLSEVQRRARKEADDKLDDLQDRKRDAANRVVSIENGVRQDQNEIYNIQNYQLPQNDSLIRTLQNERSQLNYTIGSQQSTLSNAQQQLSSYEQRVDWFTKKRNMESTQSELRSAKNALAYAQDRLQELPGEILGYQNDIKQVDVTVAQLNAEASQDQVALTKLQATKDKYEAQKAPLSANEKSYAAQLSALSKQYITNLSI